MSRPSAAPGPGQVAVVTGATSGIGRALALRLKAAGATVVGTGRDQGRLLALAGEVDLALTLDVTDDRSVEVAHAAVMDRFGRVDVLVNNAGIGLFREHDQTGVRDLQRVLDVNLLGCVRVAGAFLPDMRAAGRGCLVQMASVAGLRGYPRHTAYCASKHALVGWSRALRKDLRGSGVDVVVVCPPAVDTPFFANAGYTTWREDHPGFAPMRPEAVADATIEAIRRRRREVVVSPRARALHALDQLAPSLVDGLQAWKTRLRPPPTP
jgi:uncharacterized protein